MASTSQILSRITKRQRILIAYLPIHMIWYFIIEAVHNTNDYTVIHCALDDLIPFCEWFIIPYLLWFLYMVVTGLYFLINDPEAFEKYILSMWIGFFFSMLICTVFPTGQDLRPLVFERDNIATRFIGWMYSFDTNTNVFPSMHVVGAIAVMVSIATSKTLKNKRFIQIASPILFVFIVLATMFLKQHSALDVIAAFGLEALVLIIVYKGWASKLLDRFSGTVTTETILPRGN